MVTVYKDYALIPMWGIITTALLTGHLNDFGQRGGI